MCGIYGFTGKPTSKTARALAMLAVLNESRGTDSAGMAFISQANFKLVKAKGTSSKLLLHANPLRNLWLGGSNPVTVIGHTRQATHGAVTDENAHPFTHDTLVYAHNGIIDNFTELQAKLGTKYKVDSQIIGELLARYGANKALSDKLGGSYAIPWVDTSKPELLNLARYVSPLSFTVRPDRLQFYFSSEADHLKLALQYAGYNLPINSTASGRVYSFTWDSNRIIWNKSDFTPKVRAYTYSYPTTTYAYDGYSTGKWNWNRPIGDYKRTVSKDGLVYLTPKATKASKPKAKATKAKTKAKACKLTDSQMVNAIMGV